MFKSKKEKIKTPSELIDILSRENHSRGDRIRIKFNKLKTYYKGNIISTLDQKNQKLISNERHLFEGSHDQIHTLYKMKKLKYDLWLEEGNEDFISQFGSRNVYINLSPLGPISPSITFNLSVTKEISNEILNHFKKNKQMDIEFTLAMYNKKNCEIFKQNYAEGANENSYIIMFFKLL